MFEKSRLYMIIILRFETIQRKSVFRRVIYSTKYAFFFYSELFSFSPYTSKKLPRIINTIISTRLTIKDFLIQLIDISPCLFFFSLILLQNPQRSLQIPNIPAHTEHIHSSRRDIVVLVALLSPMFFLSLVPYALPSQHLPSKSSCTDSPSRHSEGNCRMLL